MGYAGGHRIFTYASLVLSAVSALIALIPFLYIWKILRDVLDAAPNYAQAVNIPHYGWLAVLFAVLTLKKKFTLDYACPAEATGIANLARYRARSLPAVGALLKVEDSDEKQISLMD